MSSAHLGLLLFACTLLVRSQAGAAVKKPDGSGGRSTADAEIARHQRACATLSSRQKNAARRFGAAYPVFLGGVVWTGRGVADDGQALLDTLATLGLAEQKLDVCSQGRFVLFVPGVDAAGVSRIQKLLTDRQPGLAILQSFTLSPAAGKRAQTAPPR